MVSQEIGCYCVLNYCFFLLQLYKGRLQDGTTVVVRCLKLKQKYVSQNLTQYMDIISKLRHRHLVSIIGHCISDGQDFTNTATVVYLVLENVSNGTLRSHLTGNSYLIYPGELKKKNNALSQALPTIRHIIDGVN